MRISVHVSSDDETDTVLLLFMVVFIISLYCDGLCSLEKDNSKVQVHYGRMYKEHGVTENRYIETAYSESE